MRGWKRTGRFVFDRARKPRDCFDFISDVGICVIYLSLALGTAKFSDGFFSC